MTKQDIVNEIAKKTGIEKITVLKTVEAFTEATKKSLISGNDVFLRGFGTFLIQHRAKKTARNITKNTTIIIEPHNIPKFKPSKEFLNKVKTNVKA